LAPPVLLAELVMRTARAADMECVQAEFVFDVQRDGALHAFAAWFDVRFDAGVEGKVVVLDTSPSAEGTHWRQEIFYLDEPRDVRRGDVLRGKVRFLRHPRYRRHYVI